MRAFTLCSVVSIVISPALCSNLPLGSFEAKGGGKFHAYSNEQIRAAGGIGPLREARQKAEEEAQQSQIRAEAQRQTGESDEDYANRLGTNSLEVAKGLHPATNKLHQAITKEPFETPTKNDLRFAQTYVQVHEKTSKDLFSQMREMNLGEHRANVDVARVQAMRRNKPPDQVERQMTQSFNLRHKQIADGFEKQFAEHNFGLARMKRAHLRAYPGTNLEEGQSLSRHPSGSPRGTSPVGGEESRNRGTAAEGTSSGDAGAQKKTAAQRRRERRKRKQAAEQEGTSRQHGMSEQRSESVETQPPSTS